MWASATSLTSPTICPRAHRLQTQWRLCCSSNVSSTFLSQTFTLSLPFAWNFVQRSPYILSKIVLNFRSSLCSLVCFFFTALNATYCFLAYEGLSPTTGIYKLQVIIRSTCSCVAIPCGGLLPAQSRGLQKALPPHPQASRVPSKCCPPRLPGSTEAHCG